MILWRTLKLLEVVVVAKSLQFPTFVSFAAMQSEVLGGTVRTPTDAWSGLGFSNSMPEAVIKELVCYV